MQLKILTFLLVCLPAYGFGQNYYQITIYDSLAIDPDYQAIILELEGYQEVVNSLFPVVEFSVHEQVILKEVVFLIEQGYDDLLIKEMAKPIVRNILESYQVDEQGLISVAQKNKPIVERKKQIESIYTAKRMVVDQKMELPENVNDLNELRKYKLKDGERILEIGSGSISFSRVLGKKVKDCQVYLNELDTLILKRMYYELDYHPQIKKIKDKRNNEFFLIQGGENTTGIENIKFDRIIIRQTIHHFSKPYAMLTAIKSSMDGDTELIIKEHFSDYCTPSCCADSMTKNAFETLLKENGFLKTYDKKMTKKAGGNFWIYKYKLDIGQKSAG